MQRPLRFVHISDTHIHSDPDFKKGIAEYSPTRGAVELVRQLVQLPFRPDFILHTGDVVDDPTPSNYRVAREVFSKLQNPIHYLVGNHDDSEMLQREFLGVKEPRACYHYEFEAAGVRVACLDSQRSAPMPDQEEPVRGTLGMEQLAWLERICSEKDDRPLVVAVHHNMLQVGVPWLDRWMGLTDGEELHLVLQKAGARLKGVFFGHVHQNYQIVRDGVFYCSALSSWRQLKAWPDLEKTSPEKEAEPGFNVVVVDADQIWVRHHRYPRPID